MFDKVVSQVVQGMGGWLAAGTLEEERTVVQIRFTCFTAMHPSEIPSV